MTVVAYEHECCNYMHLLIEVLLLSPASLGNPVIQLLASLTIFVPMWVKDVAGTSEACGHNGCFRVAIPNHCYVLHLLICPEDDFKNQTE